MMSVIHTHGARSQYRGYLALARLLQARGQGTQALQTLDAFAQLARQQSFAPILLAQGAAVRAQLALTQGNLAAAIRWAEKSGLLYKEKSHERGSSHNQRAEDKGMAQPEIPGLNQPIDDGAQVKGCQQ